MTFEQMGHVVPPRPASNQRGFSLIELLTALGLIAILIALAMPALRQFWFTQSLYGARDSMISEIRALQSLVTSESHPLVYGMRFTTSNGWSATGRWGLIKYDPDGGGIGVPRCTQYGTGSFDSGVFNATVEIRDPSFIATSGSPPTQQLTTEQSFCRTNLKGSAGASLAASQDQFLFFYARGTATAGTLRLHQARLGATKDLTLSVAALTGRIAAP